MSELVGLVGLETSLVDARLNKFISENEKQKSFSAMSRTDKKKIWSSLFEVIAQENSSVELAEKALVCCRILSRDGTDINECIENKDIDLLIAKSGIPNVDSVKNFFEAKKVLSNLIHQSSTVQAQCTKNGFLENVIKTIENHKGREEADRFDLRLLFLLTALCPEQRYIVNSQFSGLTVFNKVLSACVGEEACNPSLAQYTVEVLRVLFNLTCNTRTEDTQELVQISGTLNAVFNQTFQDEVSKNLVVSNAINLLTNFDGSKELTAGLIAGDDLKNIQTILSFLMSKLEQLAGTNHLSLKEEVSPSLSVLWILSKAHPEVRRYLKKTILPPLTAEDIKHKPESGKSARSRLVSLLTNPDVEVATMTAELLFVLCKHNVGKLVKHSGYGNAAGLLARRGLMTGGRGEAEFSSSDESDTEEYQQEAHKVNPITGCVEKERKNPLEGMSEEQKEYEAMKLVNMMDQLMKGGFIQPATVGADGKPSPVEHILQLQEQGEVKKESGDESD